jgi:heme/copper-type cytochrome/quinol oxidase subunit 2
MRFKNFIQTGKDLYLKTTLFALSALPAMAADVDTEGAQNTAISFVKFVIAAGTLLLMWILAFGIIFAGIIFSFVLYRRYAKKQEMGQEVSEAKVVGIPALTVIVAAVVQVVFLKILTFALPNLPDLLTQTFEIVVKATFGLK